MQLPAAVPISILIPLTAAGAARAGGMRVADSAQLTCSKTPTNAAPPRNAAAKRSARRPQAARAGGGFGAESGRPRTLWRPTPPLCATTHSARRCIPAAARDPYADAAARRRPAQLTQSWDYRPESRADRVVSLVQYNSLVICKIYWWRCQAAQSASAINGHGSRSSTSNHSTDRKAGPVPSDACYEMPTDQTTVPQYRNFVNYGKSFTPPPELEPLHVQLTTSRPVPGSPPPLYIALTPEAGAAAMTTVREREPICTHAFRYHSSRHAGDIGGPKKRKCRGEVDESTFCTRRINAGSRDAPTNSVYLFFAMKCPPQQRDSMYGGDGDAASAAAAWQLNFRDKVVEICVARLILWTLEAKFWGVSGHGISSWELGTHPLNGWPAPEKLTPRDFGPCSDIWRSFFDRLSGQWRAHFGKFSTKVHIGLSGVLMRHVAWPTTYKYLLCVRNTPLYSICILLWVISEIPTEPGTILARPAPEIPVKFTVYGEAALCLSLDVDRNSATKGDHVDGGHRYHALVRAEIVLRSKNAFEAGLAARIASESYTTEVTARQRLLVNYFAR
ncbi:hypothetical protein GGX14DRAFT_407311 [Mycena pura]|uniref:Uncharacterized protein n=1 Tax=Mycena pura TaxID=153505 RepID=A0AAD6Y4J7_9AGAR|nr:hypothetical protein GGX14DRAFT_407311 [Mycena pura]